MDTDLPQEEQGRIRVLFRGATGVALAAMVTFILLRMQLYRLPLPAATSAALSAVLFVFFALAAPVACVVATRMAPRHERTGWVFLALGCALMASGDAVSLSMGGSDALGTAPTAPIASFVWISSYVAFFVAALGFLDPVPAMALSRLRRLVDIALIVLLVAAVVFSVALFPVYGLSPERTLVSGLLGYASLVLSISLLVVVVTARPRLRVWHIPLLVATLAIIAGSLGDTLFPSTERLLVGGGLAQVMDLPWLIAYAMFTLAAIVRIRQRHVALHLQEVQIARGAIWSSVAMMSATFVALPAFVYLGVSWRGDPLGSRVFIGLAGLLGLVAIGRNVVLTLENSSLRQHALVDPLTGLHNHRFFQERLGSELLRAEREESLLSIVTIDVDDFDQVNHIYGHAAGDRRLAAMAKRLAASARECDVVCRIGGDEFACIMPNTAAVDAYKVCLRIQDNAREVDDGCPLPVGLSIGIACAPEHGRTREDLAEKAAGSLYWAKLHGREQVIVYDPELVVTLSPEERIQMLEEESYVRMVQLLASAVDARDPYTQQHSRRVSLLAVGFAESIGLDTERVSDLETAALLHDIGKIGVSDAVLRKNGRLDEEEYAQVKEHPALAVRILNAIPKRDTLLPWISSHHERWDGGGYPAGLSGEEVPLEARILALCDTYDAMTSARPYRPAMAPEKALAEILACAGTQFDAGLATAFVDYMRSTPKPEHAEPAAPDTGEAVEGAVA
jgi:diguanylate cyclase (GGDEF)-like protein